MGAELTLGQTSAWIVTKSSRRRTCSERRQISLGSQERELLKLKTCSREIAPETDDTTEEGTEVQLKHTHCSQAKQSSFQPLVFASLTQGFTSRYAQPSAFTAKRVGL